MAQPRRRYNRIPDQDRDRLIEVFNGNGDYLALADTLGIKRPTARSIIVTYLTTGRRHKAPKGGARNQKVDDDIRDAIERMIDDNPLLTLLQIKTELEASLPDKPTLSTSTIARVLDGLLLTLKLAEDVPIPRNDQRVIDLRYDYAVWFMNTAIIAHCIFMDETGYNIWTRRSFGRAPHGAPARRIVNGQRGRNCNVTFAISPEVGLVSHRIEMDTVTRASFEEFLAQVVNDCSRLLPEDEPIFLIYDNARPHVNAQLPPGCPPNISIRRLPPYSPFLNPTEMAHSAFKAGVKRYLADPVWQRRMADRDAANEAGMNLQKWRARNLEDIARENVDVITQEKCARWYNRSQRYVGRCMARHPIDG